MKTGLKRAWRHAAQSRLGGVLMVCALSAPAAWAAPAIVPDTMAQRAQACTPCHGKEGRSTNVGYFPRIAGKPARYLANQLINFREGRRPYPLMTYLVEHMNDAYIAEIAAYFAALDLPYPAPQPPEAGSAALARGESLAREGDRARKIPACMACHGAALTGVLPAIPGLVGLPRDYLNAQLGTWKNGERRAHAPDCMAEVAARLTPDDVSAVSSWLAAQPVPQNAKPAPATTQALPLKCADGLP